MQGEVLTAVGASIRASRREVLSEAAGLCSVHPGHRIPAADTLRRPRDHRGHPGQGSAGCSRTDECFQSARHVQHGARGGAVQRVWLLHTYGGTVSLEKQRVCTTATPPVSRALRGVAHANRTRPHMWSQPAPCMPVSGSLIHNPALGCS
jgi:hypothetical protein